LITYNSQTIVALGISFDHCLHTEYSLRSAFLSVLVNRPTSQKFFPIIVYKRTLFQEFPSITVYLHSMVREVLFYQCLSTDLYFRSSYLSLLADEHCFRSFLLSLFTYIVWSEKLCSINVSKRTLFQKLLSIIVCKRTLFQEFPSITVYLHSMI